MSSKSLGLLALVLTALVVAACAPAAADTSQVATLQAQVAAAQSGSGNADQIATLQAQLAEAQKAAAPVEEMPSFNPTFNGPDTLVVMSIGDPSSLDPSNDYETTGQSMLNAMYDNLVMFKGSSTDEFVPMLATEWTISDDGLTYTFTVRKDVTFHDGSAFEAHDVAYTFQRNLLNGMDGATDGPMSLWMVPFFNVQSIEDVVKSEGGDDKACELVKKTIVADDAAGTVTFTLDHPTSYFTQLLANSQGVILDKEYMAKNGAWDGEDCNAWRALVTADKTKTNLYEKENGTGPYKLDHWTHGEEIVMTANENWWVKEPLWEGSTVKGVPAIKTVTFKTVAEFSTRLAAFQAGDADIIYVPLALTAQAEPMVKEWVEGPDYKPEAITIHNPNGSARLFHGVPQNANTVLFFNQHVVIEGGNPLLGSGALDGAGIPADFFSDIHVRKAFTLCFDQATYLKQVSQGEAIPARGPIVAGLPGYDANSKIPEYSIEGCKAELDQAFDGKLKDTGFTLTLAYNSGNAGRQKALEILRDGLEKAAGGSQGKITISIVSMAWPAYLADRAAGRLPVHVTGWLEDYHDSSNWVEPFMSCAGAFSAQQFFPEELCSKWDDTLNKARSTTDAQEATTLYSQLQQEAMDNAIDIFIQQPTVRHYQQMWVQGWYYRPLFAVEDAPYFAALSKVAP